METCQSGLTYLFAKEAGSLKALASSNLAVSAKMKFRFRRKKKVYKPSPKYLKHKEAARALVIERLEHFNLFYTFQYKRIFIKNHKSRWGSCSKQGNLNFNYRIIFLPPKLADYLIVHELCHLGEFNHSPRFWDLVEQTLPDWKKRRRELMAWREIKNDP
ncbi:MAG: putative metal-dependent hydrolase [Parcubacteria group bacterium]|nr:putative metal-dependent hydrolase [Parcubacteria group bacterium]